MATLTTAHVSIAVYKGDPIDSQEYRHTSLHFQFQDQSPTLLAHIVGPSGDFQFQVRSGYDPAASRNLAKLVNVGTLQVQTTSDQLTSALRAVAIKNHDREFNCQTWVENVLKMWKDRQLLSERDYDDGVDGMVEAIAEAKDDQ